MLMPTKLNYDQKDFQLRVFSEHM